MNPTESAPPSPQTPTDQAPPAPLPALASTRSQARRIGRLLAWASATLLGLVLVALGGTWGWMGTQGSLATALNGVARWLPEGQSLESTEVTGTLRAGGRIGGLRWQSPTLAVEVREARLGWDLGALWQGRLQLGELSAARVQLTPLSPSDTEPPQPLTGLVLPLPIELPALRIEELAWAATTPVVLRHLEARYRYDGAQHQATLVGLELAQGRFQGHATLSDRGPMRLAAQLEGQIDTPHPSRPNERLRLAAQARLQGRLDTPDARLQLQAALEPESTTGPLAAVRARLTAHIAPWAALPLPQADAEWTHIDLAALWPQAPHTQLSGQITAGQNDQGWQLRAQLRNRAPGPWDQQRLPLSTLDAQAGFDGSHWTLPQASAQVGDGRITLQGRYTPATQALAGEAEVQDLRPSALDSRLDRQAVQGRIRAEQAADATVRFRIDLRGESTVPRNMTTLRVDQFQAQGHWQAPVLQLEQLHVRALQAEAQGQQLRIDTSARAFDGRLQLSVPGASAQVQGQLAPQTGHGTLRLQLSEAQRLHDWLAALPGQSALLPGARLQGQAQLDARWSGGWHSLQRQLQQAGLLASAPGTTPQTSTQTTTRAAAQPFTLQADLAAPRLTLAQPARAGQAALDLAVQDLKAQLSGTLSQLQASLDGQLRSGSQQLQLHARAQGGPQPSGAWGLQFSALKAQASEADQPGPWTLQLAQPLTLTLRQHPGQGLALEASAGQAQLTGPLPGQARLEWQTARWVQAPQGAKGAPRLQTRGALHDLPLAWADALGALDPGEPALLERLGLAGDVVLAADWDIDASERLHARATLRRSRGELRLLAIDTTSTTTVRSSGTTPATLAKPVGAPAGLQAAEVTLELDGTDLRAAVRWESARAGRLQAEASSRLQFPAGRWTEARWPENAPLAATVQAQLPELGVWSALAPPGWRVKGTLDAKVQLSGTRQDPRWQGQIGADQFALRSVLDGVDLRDGHLRATLEGTQLTIDELRVAGGKGNAARILGRSGNRTEAPQDGGLLTARGTVRWRPPNPDSNASDGLQMDLRAQAERLQVQVRADRQLSVSGSLQARLDQGQFTLRGQLKADRASLLLPEHSAPRLGEDVVVRTRAGTRQDGANTGRSTTDATVRATSPPDIALTLNLGDDFALEGQGITTRLTGTLDLRSSAATGGQPRVTGEIRTDAGRYRAWGQALDVESGLVRFNGPYDNPALDILAIRPNLSVRAGVQVTGSAQAPRVRLYADPDLPDAEKLSWLVLGRSAASGGGETALLQQAALAVLGRPGAGTGGLTRRLGVDEIGLKGPRQGEDASAAALTLGKRISSALYLSYEQSLSGTLGTLYLFYDLSRRLTLRGQTGLVNALELVYTVRYD